MFSRRLDTFHVCGLVGACNELWLFEQTDESVDKASLCVGDGKHSTLLALLFVKGHQLIGVFKLELVALPVAILPIHQISEMLCVHVDETRYVNPPRRFLYSQNEAQGLANCSDMTTSKSNGTQLKTKCEWNFMAISMIKRLTSDRIWDFWTRLTVLTIESVGENSSNCRQFHANWMDRDEWPDWCVTIAWFESGRRSCRFPPLPYSNQFRSRNKWPLQAKVKPATNFAFWHSFDYINFL